MMLISSLSTKNLLLTFFCQYLVGCSTLNSWLPWVDENSIEEISVYVFPDQELRYAVNIEVVFVFSDMTNTVVNAMNAKDWFEKKTEILSSYSKDIAVMQWQIVNGLGKNNNDLPIDHEQAINVIAFAKIPNNPNAKVLITDFKTPWITLKSGILTVTDKSPVFEIKE